MRTARRFIALTVAVSAFALTTGSTSAPAQVGTAPGCDTLASVATQLQAAQGRLTVAMTTLQERLAGGGMTARQRAAARVQLALVTVQLRLVERAMAVVQAMVDRFCATSPTPPPPAPPPPPPPPPPEEEGTE